MVRVVGIRFQQDGKMLYFDAGELSPGFGEYVIAETEHGHDLGEVILGVNEMEEEQAGDALPKVIRLATQRDIQQATENRAKEKEAYGICQRKIVEHKLDMKLVSVESTFDNSKMMFYFTANQRVDFRALVKDLASTFRTRIELRQIGVRDEARMLGGLGPCGRPLCCGTFLNDFQPVSIKMAKEQNLSLNPTKISGVCGRLMCCLKYEQDQYEATRKRMPRVGRDVNTPDGPGTVTDLNVVKETVKVRIPNGDSTEIREYPLDQIAKPGMPLPQQSAQDEIEANGSEDEELIPADLMEDEVLDIGEEPETRREFARKPRKPRGEGAPRNNGRFGSRNNGKDGETREARGSRKNDHHNQDRDAEDTDDGKRSARPTRTRNGNGARGRGPREQKFGQPVRRENPDRDKKQSVGAQTDQSSAKPQDAARQETAAKPAKNGWAAAVDKALQSVE